ncbi:MAG: DivIVA domain-containing protein, partial [Gorillibacterium sp.]|nr:DivIVA domain-containing protein [Gorillibacterium sp.]
KNFSKALRGYNELEVDSYLDEIIKDYEMFGRILINLQEQVLQLQQEKPTPRAQDNLEGIMQRLRELEIHSWGRTRD